jgi:hypothetical protein
MLVVRAYDIGLEKRRLDCPYMREIDQTSIQYCAVRTTNVRYEGWHTFVGSSELNRMETIRQKLTRDIGSYQ